MYAQDAKTENNLVNRNVIHAIFLHKDSSLCVLLEAGNALRRGSMSAAMVFFPCSLAELLYRSLVQIQTLTSCTFVSVQEV